MVLLIAYINCTHKINILEIVNLRIKFLNTQKAEKPYSLQLSFDIFYYLYPNSTQNY